MRILSSRIYLMLSIGLISCCSGSQKKESILSKTSVGVYKDVPGVESAGIKRKLASVDTIWISEMRFQPRESHVFKGDTIIWINQDLVTHCVTETNNAWSSPPIPSGGSWKIYIAQSSKYYCAIHPEMEGKIVVK
jgi:plastocyanin